VSRGADPYRTRGDAAAEFAARVDPIVYAGCDGPLAAAQLDDYARDGFLRVDAIVDAEEAAALREDAAALADELAVEGAPEVIYEPDSRAIRSVFAVHAGARAAGRRLADLCADPRLVGVARQLLGGDVYVHQSRINFKPALCGRGFFWHSDFETWHAEDGMPRMRALSVSVNLSPSRPLSGPLLLLPGSHRRYVRCPGETPDEHYRESLRDQRVGVPTRATLGELFAAAAPLGGLTEATGPAGAATIFDCNAMHSSADNLSLDDRVGLFVVFNSVDNRLVAPFAGTAPRPEFVASRGRPRRSA
jgi:ectoine hydroxylase